MKHYIYSELNQLSIVEYVEAKSKADAIKQLMFIYGISKKEATKLIIS